MKLNPSPANAKDALDNEAAYKEAKTLLMEQFGIDDPAFAVVFDSKAMAENARAAEALARFGETDATNAQPLLSYDGKTYGIDPTTTPPSLVETPGVDAATIMLVGSEPTPVPEPTPEPVPVPEPTPTPEPVPTPGPDQPIPDPVVEPSPDSPEPPPAEGGSVQIFP